MVLVNVSGSCFGILLWYLPICIQGFNKIRIFKSHYEDLKNSLVKSKKKNILGLKVRNMTRKITLTKSIHVL